MKKELKPCPFCGGPGELTDAGEIGRPAFVAGCIPCGVWMPVRYADTAEQAIAAWNKRKETNAHRAKDTENIPNL